MKRRKRKPRRDSKGADQVEIPVETQSPATPTSMQDEVEKPEVSIEIQGELESLVTSIEIQREIEKPAAPLETSTDKATPAVDSAAPAEADRRTHPRYAFTAPVEVVATEPGARMQTRVRDLSEQGCYVDTGSPLPLGTAAELRITKGRKSFQARARVVFTQPGKGMGLMFTAVEPEHFGTLSTWIAESRETSWLAANRRRSQRVLMKIPVRLSAQTAAGSSLFDEETHTLAISAHGALIALSAPVYRGQRLNLSNVQTKAALECVVAHVDRFPGEEIRVGLEFLLPNATFWHVAFPPKDWTPRHPDAKSGQTGKRR
jgi:PilZ domain